MDIIRTEEQQDKILDLHKMLIQLDTSRKSLQSEKLAMVMVRYLFGEVIRKFTST